MQTEIILTGETESDLLIALEEVSRLMQTGFTSGFDRNETGSFNFSTKREQYHDNT